MSTNQCWYVHARIIVYDCFFSDTGLVFSGGATFHSMSKWLYYDCWTKTIQNPCVRMISVVARFGRSVSVIRDLSCSTCLFCPYQRAQHHCPVKHQHLDSRLCQATCLVAEDKNSYSIVTSDGARCCGPWLCMRAPNECSLMSVQRLSVSSYTAVVPKT